MLVSSSSQKEKAPVAVYFNNYRSSSDVFATLIKERGLRPDVGKKVSSIPATFSWNGRRLGLRRGDSDDWVRFCRTVRQAWESEEVAYECEVEMVLDVDE